MTDDPDERTPDEDTGDLVPTEDRPADEDSAAHPS